MKIQDYQLFGSSASPLRISSLPSLVLCPMKEFLLWEGLLQDESGPAAQTGNMAHDMIAFLHTAEFDVAAARRELQQGCQQRYPRGNWETAVEHVEGYAADARNVNAEILGIEHRCELVLPPHELDPTGLPVVMHGTVDQIRREPCGGSRVYDIKTGRQPGLVQLDLSAVQLAAYTLACGATLPPAVIMTAAYTKDTAAIFQSTYSIERCRALLDRVTLAVAMIRRGRIELTPGFHCGTICPAKSASNCLHLWECYCNARIAEAGNEAS